MADPEHVELVRQGGDAIRAWREKNDGVRLDLRKADLSGADLRSADLRGAGLARANLHGADLNGADLSEADLIVADLSDAGLREAKLRRTDLRKADLGDADLAVAELHSANLSEAHLNGADLVSANLTEAYLGGTDLSGANLRGANLTFATLHQAILSNADFSDTRLLATVFADVDLSSAKNLHESVALSPSTIGIDTILSSGGKIPDEFLRACGVNPVIQRMLVGTNATRTDAFYSWLDEPIRLNTCFISYSTTDKPFVDRLQRALNERGVDYWYAPEHGEWGEKLTEQIDREISLRDRVVLVCSEASLNESDWVQWEITKALEQENFRKKTVLFPVMLDDALLTWDHPSAVHVREVLAGDFRKATRGNAFENAADRLYRALYARPALGK